jgi:hypothetical protein
LSSTTSSFFSLLLLPDSTKQGVFVAGHREKIQIQIVHPRATYINPVSKKNYIQEDLVVGAPLVIEGVEYVITRSDAGSVGPNQVPKFFLLLVFFFFSSF